MQVAVAEMQTNGRGRVQRKWLSGLGNGLTLSVKWIFPAGIANLSSLSLLVSLAITRILKSIASIDIKVKWPNDVIHHHKKLGGILIEGRYESTGEFIAIIGIGINIKLSENIKLNIDREITDLFEATGLAFDRNLILSELLDELIDILNEFEQSGFAPFKDEWIRYHAYQGEFVKLLMPDNSEILGFVAGIGDDGAICLRTADGDTKYFVNGEISLRHF